MSPVVLLRYYLLAFEIILGLFTFTIFLYLMHSLFLPCLLAFNLLLRSFEHCSYFYRTFVHIFFSNPKLAILNLFSSLTDPLSSSFHFMSRTVIFSSLMSVLFSYYRHYQLELDQTSIFVPLSSGISNSNSIIS